MSSNNRIFPLFLAVLISAVIVWSGIQPASLAGRAGYDVSDPAFVVRITYDVEALSVMRSRPWPEGKRLFYN